MLYIVPGVENQRSSPLIEVDGREKSELILWPVAEFERESHSVGAWGSDDRAKTSEVTSNTLVKGLWLPSFPIHCRQGYLVSVSSAYCFRCLLGFGPDSVSKDISETVVDNLELAKRLQDRKCTFQ